SILPSAGRPELTSHCIVSMLRAELMTLRIITIAVPNLPIIGAHHPLVILFPLLLLMIIMNLSQKSTGTVVRAARSTSIAMRAIVRQKMRLIAGSPLSTRNVMTHCLLKRGARRNHPRVMMKR
uniref:Uncharacterized protein n=1 Tax=Laticauda laticaudata TaxID=8630 RepID=A0A8C5SG22_LATLA